jgi:L-fucose mutarotase/ribose pyranase (RbsD/FucU family)
MFHAPALQGNLYPRRQLPESLLPMLLEAHRAGHEFFDIAICDQLAPSRKSNANVLFFSSIPDCIRAVTFHCPPVTSGTPVVTMAPDVADRHEHSPDKIRNQWRATIEESWPTWSEVPFTSLDRNEFYQRLPTVNVVVRTLSTEPYANVILRVNPRASTSLASIPDMICPQLAEEISLAGHSHALVVGPEDLAPYLSSVPESAARFSYHLHRTPDVLSIITDVWLPDTHEQHPDLPLQTPLGSFSPQHEPTLDELVLPLGQGWLQAHFLTQLDENQWRREISDRRVVALITTAAHPNDKTAYVVKNWISGHNGGY